MNSMPPHPTPERPRIASADFSLLIVGDEILSGKRADKHMPKLIELLAARGLQLRAAEYVGDNPAHITASLHRARSRVQASGGAVFCCGGIGATPDDHTRWCAAQAWGLPLVLHPEAAALIHERMRDVAAAQGTPYDPHEPISVHRLNMAMFPQGADIIPNPYNKIAGFSLGAGALGEQGGAPSGGRELHAVNDRGGEQQAAAPGRLFFFPGFPVMAWPMMEWVLDTYAAHLFQTQAQLE
ncbi:MAG: competence/damage-inducible protein A, partial [Burkholderiaceae bacterium]